MQLLLKHKLLIAGVTAVAAASGGGAYAATQSTTNPRQAFLNDVAKRLNVSPGQLSAAVAAALIDRLNAAVKSGKITPAQAKQLEQRVEQGGPLPFFFAAPGFGPGDRFGFRPGGPGIIARRGGGILHAAAAYLGLTDAQLFADLTSGKSLAQIAKDRGKSVSGLKQALITAETARLGQLQSKGVISKALEQRILSRLSARVNRLVNRTGFPRPPLGKLPHMVGPGVPGPQGGPGVPPPQGGQGVPGPQGGPMIVPPAAIPPAAGGDGPLPPSA